MTITHECTQASVSNLVVIYSQQYDGDRSRTKEARLSALQGGAKDILADFETVGLQRQKAANDLEVDRRLQDQ